MTACLGLMTGRVTCDNDLLGLQKNLLSEMNTASPLFITKRNMEGDLDTVYHVNFIYLLDRVFWKDTVGFLSTEQTTFIDLFFKEAHEVTERLQNNPDEDAYVNMTITMKQLDEFLGSFVGVNNEQFTR